MALFQVSVLKKYLKLQDDQVIDKAYKKFTTYFQHPEIQENIRSSKEEQFQATFLNELFVKILGYSMNPNPSYNLTTEYKNEKNARKADGAILNDGTAIGVIELKGTNTKHLEGIRQQAFDYKANQKGCVYVITSNFEKLRFYIHDATEFLEFDLFELNRYDFSLLWLCLQKENIHQGLPLKIKEASLMVEEAITKEFYKDYSVFKRELYRDLVRKNAKNLKTFRSSEIASESLDHLELQNDVNRLEKNVKLNLFKKSQKLIDRFLFIFFAEDRGLLPPNSIHKILADWNKLKELDAHVPLYDRFKLYFKYLDTGRKGSDTSAEIFAYNGGLFKPDAILDVLEIDDELLNKHTAQLAKYDFESQVDVNILGHIFENSLNEIESVNAEIEGGDFDKQKSKRKKDGVFYTPKYITKYIVENTVGKLCEEKKTELGFREEEYYRGRKRRQKETLEALVKILDDYRVWLLQLTICDPACGSGAFLNQALDFLIKEHRYIDEMKAKLLGGGIVFSDIENTILENNIYGVDLNEESVEIAKLSLWLRTAQPRRKLNDLSNTIKCGNSLIDDKKVAGDKAFKWEEEFPEVFNNGGFDVVIGNPPYVRVEFISEIEVKYYKEKYRSSTGKFDLSSLFFEKSIELLNPYGIYSIITSYQFIYTSSGLGLRKFITEETKCSILMFSSDSQVFIGATTYAGIFIAQKGYSDIINILSANNELQQVNITNEFDLKANNFSSTRVIVADTSLLDKLKCNKDVIRGNEIGMAKTGVVTSADDVFYLTAEQVDNYNLETKLLYPIIGPAELDRWILHSPETLCLYPYEEIENKTTLIKLSELKSKYNGIYTYLQNNKKILTARSQGRKDYSRSNKWYQLNRPREKWIYDSEKLIYPGTTNKPKFAYDESGQVFRNARVYAYILKPDYSKHYKAIMPILNSSLTGYLMLLKCPPKANKYFELSTGFMESFPFILPKGEIKTNFEEISERIIKFTKDSNYFNNNFQKYLVNHFKLGKISKKLENWHELDFREFIKELNKAITAINKVREKAAKESGCVAKLVQALTKKDEFEWMELFEENKKKALALLQQISATDREIDQMVYELYGLTDEEIAIVENS